jgi:LPPG:FO 2-phospho-L-lactate transferase
MFRELGIEPSALAVADHYRDILTGFVLDSIDAELAQKLEVESFVTDILMKSPEDRKRLANEVLIWMGNL